MPIVETHAGPFTVRTDVAGSGAPVLFIHSSGLGPFQWRAYAKALPDHRVLIPALTGYPPSDLFPKPIRDAAALDIAGVGELLDQQEEPVHLVAHSYGGFVAATLAKARPSKVKTIALLEPVMFGALRKSGDPEGMTDVAHFDENPWFIDDEVAGTEKWFRFFVDYWNAPGAWDAMGTNAKASFLNAGWKVSQEVRSVMFDALPFEAYRFERPLLLMRGGRSTAGARTISKHLARVNPGSKLIDLPDAGHMFPMSHVLSVLHALREHWSA